MDVNAWVKLRHSLVRFAQTPDPNPWQPTRRDSTTAITTAYNDQGDDACAMLQSASRPTRQPVGGHRRTMTDGP